MRTIEQVRFTPSIPRPERVAAYAGVSGGKEAMLHSLSAQVCYYSNYIQNNGWEYAGVYADEAITGTKDKRDGILTPGGKTEWEKKVVLSILTNEKYKGAALLQKRYTVDFLQKKTKVDRVTVYNDDRLVYSLKDGGEITVML